MPHVWTRVLPSAQWLSRARCPLHRFSSPLCFLSVYPSDSVLVGNPIASCLTVWASTLDM
eukprot:m.110435 g.110435  ORF g.110435 m.110435 type:complete len:60 (+) comp51804_c0_seq3:382-561(+)